MRREEVAPNGRTNALLQKRIDKWGSRLQGKWGKKKCRF